MIIRSAEPADLPRLQAIETAAGEIFRTVGMAAIADDAPPTIPELERYRQAGHAWVATEDTGIEDTGTENIGTEETGTEGAGTVIAYLVAEVVDGAFHIEQVTVHPDAARRGVGQTLIACAADCARGQGLTGLTLTTFADVPWNAPYYERLGFRRLSGAELTPGLRAIRAAEAEHGLDRWPRVCMRRDL
ncbi:GNAT family N-acetyltransferase [Streptomyces sp. NPDC102360]|uniref:GNAT family N-acetyltransferase n=1 Tax=Streptomyces sp. NPDC102360 TaxID=3366160 RepID=UPI0038281674